MVEARGWSLGRVLWLLWELTGEGKRVMIGTVGQKLDVELQAKGMGLVGVTLMEVERVGGGEVEME